MSITLPIVDMTGKTVGQNGQIPLKTAATNWNIAGHTGDPATIRILNENGCGLQVWTDTNQINEYLAAGAWIDYQIEQGTLYLNWLVKYTMPNPPANILMVTFYSPGEKVPPMATLGNSPIGGGTTTAVTGSTLSNEGNTTPALIIDIGQVANTNLINVFSDGSFTWNMMIAGTVHTLLKGELSGNSLLLGMASDIVEVLGNLTVDGNIIAGAAQFASTDFFGAVRLNSNTLSGITTATAGTLQSNSLIDSAGVSHIAITPGGGVTRIQDAAQISLQVPGGSGVVSVISSGVNLTGGLAVTGGTTLQNGCTVTGNSLFLTQGSWRYITNGSFSTNNTLTQNVAHNMTTTPDQVIIWCAGGTSTTTASVVSIGATNFVVSSFIAGVSMHFEARKY